MDMMGCVKNTNKSLGNETEMSIKKNIKGTVVLMKKNVLDLNDFGSSFLDWVYEMFNKRVSIQLISSTHCDPCMYHLITNICIFNIYRICMFF